MHLALHFLLAVFYPIEFFTLNQQFLRRCFVCNQGRLQFVFFGFFKILRLFNFRFGYVLHTFNILRVCLLDFDRFAI